MNVPVFPLTLATFKMPSQAFVMLKFGANIQNCPMLKGARSTNSKRILSVVDLIPATTTVMSAIT